MFGKEKIKELNKEVEWLKNKVHELNDHIQSLKDEMQDEISSIHSDMEGYKSFKTEQELLKNSDEPWCDFQTNIQPDGRVKIKMDWNKAFIQWLKENGFKASNEEDMVSAYFSSLVREAGDELTEEEAEELLGNG